MTAQSDELSLGQQLKAAREALGISSAMVAEKTTLKQSHIEAFENDIFILKNIPPMFVRGYVRSYLRFLRLPESLMNNVSYGEVTITRAPRRAAPMKAMKVKNASSQRRWLQWLTWLILLTAVSMTVVWWWQEHQKEQDSQAQYVAATTVESQPQPEPLPSPAPTETAAPQAVNLTENSATSAPPVQVESQPVVVTEAPMTVAEQPAPIEELRIEIHTGESWISVKDGNEKRLAEKLYAAGETISLNGNEQYRLTIGAPANVKIYYKGQEVPLKIDGRVAKLRLPLAN